MLAFTTASRTTRRDRRGYTASISILGGIASDCIHKPMSGVILQLSGGFWRLMGDNWTG